ncbi:MAG: hypothetical protein AMXMBFR61_10970 [Fimbriimonadales bacterium]
MRSPLSLLFRVSRFRFWLYLGGTYLVGYAAGASELRDLASPLFAWYLIFFLVPANLLLYGVNDLFDTDTDSQNPKKQLREHRVSGEERRVVAIGVAICAGLLIALVVLASSAFERVMLAAFLALSIGYSVPPLRFKARALLDSCSNVLYALPGFLGYYQASGSLPVAPAVIAAWCWTAAMHLFSAVPDIESDRRVGLQTTATMLGPHGSLIACSILWTTAAVILIASGTLWPWSLGSIVYPAIPLALVSAPPCVVERAYWRFPLINGLVGGLAFLLVVPKG